VTRMESVRAATGNAKVSARHAKSAMDKVAPRVSHATRQAQCAARDQYEHRVAPRIAHARHTLPPTVDRAATRAARRTRKAARQAADYAGPKMEAARAAAGPAREEAVSRSTAAIAALRGDVTPAEVHKLNRKRVRRARAGKAFKSLGMLGALVGVAVATWRWWDKQANPGWLVEPPAPTEVNDRSPLGSVDGSSAEADRSVLDPEVEAKQAETETDEGEEPR
jgi:Family of unknown function (DUF5324)